MVRSRASAALTRAPQRQRRALTCALHSEADRCAKPRELTGRLDNVIVEPCLYEVDRHVSSPEPVNMTTGQDDRRRGPD